MHAIYRHTKMHTYTNMNLSTVKWAQWDKTHSRELFGLFICVCIALCTIVAHNIAQNRPDNFPPYPPDNHRNCTTWRPNVTRGRHAVSQLHSTQHESHQLRESKKCCHCKGNIKVLIATSIKAKFHYAIQVADLVYSMLEFGLSRTI